MPAVERRAELKEALLRAAERAIETRGLEGVRARDLAREAGCAVGAIYNVFDDLDSLVLRVNLRTLASFEAFLARSAREPADADAGAAVDDLVRLAAGYLAFASAHPRRWRALFQHRMADEKPVPDWYLDEQVRLFRYIERPLCALQPQLGAGERTLLARSLFSAVHGVVSLGLDEKLGAIPLDALASQVERIIAAIGRGLMAARAAGGGMTDGEGGPGG